jgi:hypothetical protein
MAPLVNSTNSDEGNNSNSEKLNVNLKETMLPSLSLRPELS